MNYERANKVVVGVMAAFMAVLIAGFAASFVWPNKRPPAVIKLDEKSWDLGYAAGNFFGSSEANARRPVPTAEELASTAASMRSTAGLTEPAAAAAFERGFASGFRDGFKASSKPAF